MINGHTIDKPRAIVPTELTLLKYKPNTRVAVHYKFSVDRDTQKSGQVAADQHDYENLKHNWKDEVQLLD